MHESRLPILDKDPEEMTPEELEQYRSLLDGLEDEQREALRQKTEWIAQRRREEMRVIAELDEQERLRRIEQLQRKILEGEE